MNDRNNDNNNDKKGLFIPSRQVSAYTALSFVLVGVVFMTGYFFGKKQMVDQFVAKVEHDSFSDQIYSALCALSDQDEQRATALMQRDLPQKKAAIALEAEAGKEIAVEKAKSPEPTLKAAGGSKGETPEQQFYAQLIGYGTQKAAACFAQKLQKKGIPSFVKTRKSQTAQGKRATWYQVVTAPFGDRESLDRLTQRIAREEKIQGIQIVAC